MQVWYTGHGGNMDYMIRKLFELMKSKENPLILRLIVYVLISGILLGISYMLLVCSYNQTSIILLSLSVVVFIVFIFMTKVMLEK